MQDFSTIKELYKWLVDGNSVTCNGIREFADGTVLSIDEINQVDVTPITLHKLTKNDDKYKDMTKEQILQLVDSNEVLLIRSTTLLYINYIVTTIDVNLENLDEVFLVDEAWESLESLVEDFEYSIGGISGVFRPFRILK